MNGWDQEAFEHNLDAIMTLIAGGKNAAGRPLIGGPTWDRDQVEEFYAREIGLPLGWKEYDHHRESVEPVLDEQREGLKARRDVYVSHDGLGERIGTRTDGRIDCPVRLMSGPGEDAWVRETYISFDQRVRVQIVDVFQQAGGCNPATPDEGIRGRDGELVPAFQLQANTRVVMPDGQPRWWGSAGGNMDNGPWPEFGTLAQARDMVDGVALEILARLDAPTPKEPCPSCRAYAVGDSIDLLRGIPNPDCTAGCQ